MCDALPPAKGKEMKRAYWACISVRKWLLLLCQNLTSKCLNELSQNSQSTVNPVI